MRKEKNNKKKEQCIQNKGIVNGMRMFVFIFITLLHCAIGT